MAVSKMSGEQVLWVSFSCVQKACVASGRSFLLRVSRYRKNHTRDSFPSVCLSPGQCKNSAWTVC